MQACSMSSLVWMKVCSLATAFLTCITFVQFLQRGLDFVISLPSGQLCSVKSPVVQGLVKQILLRAGFIKKNKMLWAYFKSFLSPCWTWSTLSPISQCENLVGILKLRLTKVEDPSLTLGPPGVCNSHTCCTEPPAICQSRFRFPPWCPWRFLLAPFCSGK